MTTHEKYTELLPWHRGVEHFDYGPVIDWAIELIRNGQETENVLILASFSKPIDSNDRNFGGDDYRPKCRPGPGSPLSAATVHPTEFAGKQGFYR